MMMEINNNGFNLQNLDEVSINLKKRKALYLGFKSEYIDYDESILTTDSEELRKVNAFFSGISGGNRGIEVLLYEWLGYTATRLRLGKAIIFWGSGRNGKSTLCRIQEALLRDNAVSHENLEALSGSKSGGKSTVKRLEHCYVNISEDQRNLKYCNTSLLCRLISGEPISVGKKADERYDIRPFVKLVLTVNEVVDLHSSELYMKDRFMIIPFRSVFTDENPHKRVDMENLLRQPKILKIIVAKSIQAFDNVIQNGKFTIPASVKEATRNYFLEFNNVEEFCLQYPLSKFISISRLYEEYCSWCNSCNQEAVANGIFGKKIQALGFRKERYSFGGIRDNYYVAPSFDNSQSRGIYEEYIKTLKISKEDAESYNKTGTPKTFNIEIFNDYLWGCILEEIDMREANNIQVGNDIQTTNDSKVENNIQETKSSNK